MRRRRSITICALAAFLLAPLPAYSDVPNSPPAELPAPSTGGDIVPDQPVLPEIIDEAPFDLREVAAHFELPWSIAFLPGDRILITERRGRLRLIDAIEPRHAWISGVPEVLSGGHSGLLDVIVDPNFATNGLIYLSHMHGVSKAATTRIVRARLDGLALVDRKVLFESSPPLDGLDQIGGRLAFGPDGMLYMTIGDRFIKDRAQDLGDHAGTIIRINPDGGIPADNPFAGRPDVLPEIFSYGHRNPQGLVINHHDGKLWSVEQGPQGGDEINLITAGGNYGWPAVTHGIDYDGSMISPFKSADGMVDPMHVWVPSIAASSLAYFNGEQFADGWQDTLLVGALKGEMLVKLNLRHGRIVREQRFLSGKIGRIRQVAVSPGGTIYILTDGTDASLYRVDPHGADEVSKATSGKPQRRMLPARKKKGAG